MLKPLTVNHNKLWKILQEMGIPDHLASWEICMQVKKQQLEQDCKDPKFGPSFQGGKTARPNKPAQQMQHARGFIDGCTNRVTLISWEAEHTEQQIEQVFICKKTILSAYYIRVTKWLVTRLQSNPIGTNFAGFGSYLMQFYWYKRRRLLF